MNVVTSSECCHCQCDTSYALGLGDNRITYSDVFVSVHRSLVRGGTILLYYGVDIELYGHRLG